MQARSLLCVARRDRIGPAPTPWSPGGDGGDRPHGQKVVGATPSSRPTEILLCQIFETVKCTLKIRIIIMPVTKVVQISA